MTHIEIWERSSFKWQRRLMFCILYKLPPTPITVLAIAEVNFRDCGPLAKVSLRSLAYYIKQFLCIKFGNSCD